MSVAGQRAVSPAQLPPTLRVEKRLLRSGFNIICAVDEVGRGALGGPVSVGMVLIDVTVRRPLAGVRDSKLLTPAAREALLPRIRRWVLGHAVAHASAEEIDAIGIMAALRLAGTRAARQLPATADVMLLDGNHNWLVDRSEPGLFDDATLGQRRLPPVVTMIKADMRCCSVAAASVLAKTERDTIMRAMARCHPGYGWHENKGYATPLHLAALRELGPSTQHRQSWRLPEPGSATAAVLFELPAGSTCAAAEPTRNAAEPTRQAAEPTRQAAEPTRQAAEPTRQAAEPTRNAAVPASMGNDERMTAAGCAYER